MQHVQEFRSAVVNEPFDLMSFVETVRQYEKAKTRLLAAQQEKMEATVELVTLRASLAHYLEGVWPGQAEDLS